MSLYGLVVGEGSGSPAYKVNTRQEATLSPDGRLRVQGGGTVSGVTPITPGTPFSGGNSISYIATSAGNFTVTFPDGSTIPNIPLVVGSIVMLSLGASMITLNSGAATFFNGLSDL